MESATDATDKQGTVTANIGNGAAEGKGRGWAREGAFLAVLTGWFRDGMRESLVEMANMCCRILV